MPDFAVHVFFVHAKQDHHLGNRRLREASRGEAWRTVIPDAAPTGKTLREHYRNGGGKVSGEYLDAVEKAAAHIP